MKKSFFWVCILLTIEACSQNEGRNTVGTETVFYKKDDAGRTVEKWGNEKTYDNDINFRYLYQYDSIGRLIQEKQYHFDDENISCEIVDSLDFILVEYTYGANNQKLLQKKYFQVYDDQTKKATRHKLGYIYDYQTNTEKIF